MCVAGICTATACAGRIGMPGPQVISAGYGSLLGVADMNRDGRPDVVLGDSQGGPGGVVVVLQDGTGGFRTPAIYDLGTYPYGMAVGDLLGNGNPDVVTVNCGPYTGFAQVLFNDKGDGVLAPGVVYACDGGVRGHGVAIGDINGDGNADIVVAADLPGVRIFWGSSSGSFTGPTFYDGPLATGVTVADLNGDGLLDLATGENGFGLLSVWMNVGDGGFAPPVSYSGNGDPILVADINGDGLPDLIGTDAYSPCGGSFVVLLNQGSGLFSGPTRYVLGFGDCAKGVGVGDVDGDGRPDVVMSLENSGALIWRNMGDGGFEQALHAVLGNYHFGGLGLADFTGTGLTDIFLSQELGPVSVLLPNTGDGGFLLPLPALAVGPTTLTIADVDGDGRPDVVAPGSIFFNDAGLPSTQVDFAFPSGVVSITTGDLNGDGRPDIVAGGAQLYVAINDGGAFPVVSTYPPAVSSVSALVLGDFNADGKIDVAVTGANEGLVSVLLNDGTGQLRSASTFDAGLAPTAMVGVDVNGDGTLDLATVNSTGSSIALLLGRGDGTFAPPIFYSVGVAPHAIAVGDLDGDGRPDLVVGNSASSDVSILLNSATGLLPATALGVGINVESVQVTDLNSDGRRDIAVGGSEPFEPFGAVVLLLSDSSGGFKRREYIVSVGAPGTFNCVPPTSNLLFADFNADGRPDVAMACSGGRINVQLTSCMP